MIHNKRKTTLILALILMLTASLLAGCGSGKGSSTGSSGSSAKKENTQAPKIQGLKYQSKVKTENAKQFEIWRYEGGYRLIVIHGISKEDDTDDRYLVVPEGKKTPSHLSSSTVVIQRPLSHIYNAATATMSLANAVGGLDQITLSSLKESGWTFDAPRKRMAAGKMRYAGKYSEPDYEMLVAQKCDLAIESTMIYHTPEVKEMIEDLKIPVLVDHSSYEKDPLGRTEWVKVYGALLGKEKEADAFFQKQKTKLKDQKQFKKTGKSVAFFYISTDGKAVVRRNDDYVPAMIRMAGGDYAYSSVKSGSSAVPMSIEKFYDLTKDTDILVYNGDIDRTVRTLADLKGKDPVMKKLSAVKKGRCYVTGSAMYQRTDLTCDMVLDFHRLLSGDDGDLQFMTKLK